MEKAIKYGSEFLFGCFHNLVTPSGVPILGFSDLEVFFGSDGLHFFFLFFFFFSAFEPNECYCAAAAVVLIPRETSLFSSQRQLHLP